MNIQNCVGVFLLSFAMQTFPKLALAAPEAHQAAEMHLFRQNARVLFQGDSITDGNRGRNSDPNHILGHGFVFIIAAKYGAQMPERNLTFINRGISGNKVSDLTARWQHDTLDLKPDILSILIGINDASAQVAVQDYEQGLDALLKSTLVANPETRLVLCEPFTLPGARHQDDWEAWRANVQAKQDAVARLAAKYQVPLVRFQRAFDEATKRAPASYWIWDTIHPTYSGHQIMADEWIRTVSEFSFPPKPFVPPVSQATP